MRIDTMEVVERVKALIAPYLEEHGIELVDMIYRREQQGMVLRLLADAPSGISIKECEELNHHVGDLLDEEDIVDGHYIIEVSSPGLDRPLASERDFERVMGRVLQIATYEPVEGKRDHVGKLVGMNSESVVLEASGVSTVIPRLKIAKATQKIDF